MVVAGGVEGELAEEFSVWGDDPDVAVGDEHEDCASVVAGSHADVVEPALVADGDGSVFVDFVVADPVVRVGGGVRGPTCLNPARAGDVRSSLPDLTMEGCP